MPTNTDILKKRMLEALESSLGVVTSAAKKAGINRSTHYDWMEKDAEYKRAVDELSNVALDFAESQLHKQIQDGNPTSTIFYLKTKGKVRGYVERREQDINLNQSGTVDIKKWLDDNSGKQ